MATVDKRCKTALVRFQGQRREKRMAQIASDAGNIAKEKCAVANGETQKISTTIACPGPYFCRARFPRFNRSSSLKRFLPFFARQFAVRDSLPDYLPNGQVEAIRVIQRIVRS